MSESNFTEEVREAVRQIPKGQTMSYGEVAAAVGRPKASRAVGTVLKDNYDPTVPCHRVIRADGAMGEYNRGGPKQKRALLVAEGVKF